MRIVAPISSVEELPMLLHCGADELYCGVDIPEWRERFGTQWWMNRRHPLRGSIGSLEDLQTITTTARDHGVMVHVALNTPFYTPSAIDTLLALSERLVNVHQVDGLIVSDVELLSRLVREGHPVRIHLSSLGRCFNSCAVEFYRSLGVQRIILPRQLRLSEIEHLVKAHGAGMEFEVFALNDGCYYEEGFCLTSHPLGPFCLTPWKVTVLGSENNGPSDDELAARVEDLREYLWYQNNCGSSHAASGLPNGPCSLCWFGHFREWGVTAVKIVGREGSFLRKMGSLQLVKAVMETVRNGAAPEDVAGTALSLRATPEYCRKGYMCTFRDH
jgi:putative protease